VHEREHKIVCTAYPSVLCFNFGDSNQQMHCLGKSFHGMEMTGVGRIPVMASMVKPLRAGVPLVNVCSIRACFVKSSRNKREANHTTPWILVIPIWVQELKLSDCAYARGSGNLVLPESQPQ
jgi:hypothetical protein